MIDVAAIPDGLENSVGKPKRHDVLDGFFAEVVVDPVDLLFANNLQELLVESSGRVDVASKRLFDNDPSPLTDSLHSVRPVGAQLLDDWSQRSLAR